MKTIIANMQKLKEEGRWDIDYHLPPAEIKKYPEEIIVPVSECAKVIKNTRDPTQKPDESFIYVDISSIDVETGLIVNSQELTGEEAPSRARKVIQAYDIIVSTCRPTRGAISVIPEELHGQICSTGFSVLRVKEDYNPFYLHFALRLPSTLEQFRKWSTGSSYPAILDEDIEKTLIPILGKEYQDKIANLLRNSLFDRQEKVKKANKEWMGKINGIIEDLQTGKFEDREINNSYSLIFSIDQIREKMKTLEPINEREPNKNKQIDMDWDK